MNTFNLPVSVSAELTHIANKYYKCDIQKSLNELIFMGLRAKQRAEDRDYMARGARFFRRDNSGKIFSTSSSRIEVLESALYDIRSFHDSEEKQEIRSAYNEVCDRLDVLISKIHELSDEK